MDIMSWLCEDRRFGPTLAAESKIAIKFSGKPATSKNHQYKGINEDVICDAADVPFQREESLVSTASNERRQQVFVSNPNLASESDWMKIQSTGSNTANMGALKIVVYNTFNTHDYQPCFEFNAANALLTKYTTNGQAVFDIVGGKVDWTCKLKSITKRPGTEDACNSWNNSN